ncbi:MAG: amino acid adenylation domain-containing protein [Symploca sp. SIO2E9]|nr:amino acid adenylation domain-containing protein [Symploca sp. SIO2E9]
MNKKTRAGSPLSYGQQAMWLIYQLDPKSIAYNIFVTAKIHSSLNLAVFTRVWEKIVEHHPILRTTYTVQDDKPVQQINKEPKFTVQVIDASSWSEAYLTEKIYSETDRPFNLEKDSVLRVTLLTCSEKEHILLLTMHHIAGDMWSFDLLLSEFQALYTAEIEQATQEQTKTVEGSLIENKSYLEFVRWQSEMLSDSRGEKYWQYWQKQLAGELPILNLLTDKPRPTIQTYQGNSYFLKPETQLIQKLNNLAQSFGKSLYQILLTAFYIQLYRYTNQEEILIGSPMRGRWGRDFKKIIGYFVNLVPLRLSVDATAKFTELLTQVSKIVKEAQKHQNYPFSLLAEQLQPQRDPSRPPLCQVSFVWQQHQWCQSTENSLHTPALVLEMEPYLLGHQRGADWDLGLMVMEAQGILKLCWQYNTDLFEAATIERMAGHFVTLLENIVADPQQQIWQLPLITEVEKRQLLIEWNNTQADYPQDQCLHQLFEQQVERTPDAVAVVFAEQQLTYGELNCRANQLAHYLQSLAVGADVLVGLYVERSLEMVVGMLGILKAGGAYVPLDPNYPQERLSFMLEDAQVPVILTQHHLVEKLSQYQARILCLDTHWQLISPLSQGNLIPNLQPHNLAYVIYTSGSTGKPKGITVTHQAVNRLVCNTNYINLTANHRVAQASNAAFDAATFEIWGALLHGAKLVGITKEVLLSPPQLAKQLQDDQIDCLFVTTALFNQLVSQVPGIFKTLQTVLFGGEAVEPNWVRTVMENQPPKRLLHLYGPTENTTFSSWYLVEEVPEGATNLPIGKPIANTQIYILDRHLQPVPIGIPGELCIGGDGLARGYLNRPDLTQEKFILNSIPETQLTCQKLYKTGDLARYLPDGNIEFMGRIDNQVKIRGFRIELSEIEVVLTQHPQVRDAIVMAREDQAGSKSLAAYVVPEGKQPSSGELRSFLQDKLPDYMLPVSFTVLESLPLTPNGKVDRRALPQPDLSQQTQEYIAPRTPTEEILTQIWSQILKVEKVGINDNFFELGGHSLLATQVVSRIRNSFQIELPLRELFAAPTIAQLAQSIGQLKQQNQGLTAPPIRLRQEGAELSLSYAQNRLWFLNQLELNDALYNIPITLRLAEIFPETSLPLEVTTLEKSLQEIIQRHEALRTNFVSVDGKTSQIIHAETNWTLSVVDLGHLSITEQEIALQQLAQKQATQAFDLASHSLIRATLAVLSETEHFLLVCMHHIVSDGWSMDVLIKELTALYEAYCQGQPSPLAPLQIQYADFAIWQREWLQGEVLQRQLNYWQNQLADAPELLSLPTDRPRPAVQTFRGAHQQFALSTELTSRLTQLSQQQGVTLFMTLLAAFETLLYRYSGQSDITVGTPIANRNQSEIEGLIGFFVNTLVLRTNLEGNPSFSELLSRVKFMAMDAYAHQDLPFEMLVEALQPERDLSYTPLFQVMFALRNESLYQLKLAGLVEIKTSKFDLTLSMENTADGLVGVWEYSTDLFDASTIERMTSHWVTLLEGIVSNPQQQISQLPLLTEVEKGQLLVEWNNTQTDYPQNKCIHQWFEEIVERTPNAIAVVFENQTLTYCQLNRRANQLAHYLQSLGVGADVLVGLYVERSLEMVVGMLGILKAGGAYVPLDPDYPTERLSFMLEDTQVKVLLSQQQLVDSLPQYQGPIICLDKCWEVIGEYSQENPVIKIQTNNLAYVIYTSGSTGQPKGVMLSHRNLCNHMLWMQTTFSLTEKDKVLQKTPFSFDASVWEFYAPLLVGGKLILAQPGAHGDPVYLWKVINQHQVTTVQFVPSVLQIFLEHEGIETSHSLKRIFCGGEVLPVALQESLLSKLKVNLYNLYGPTEACIDATFWDCKQERVGQVIPIGRPIKNAQIYILDSHLQPVPVGVAGELHIGGAGVARGYLNRPELTQEKFICNPFNNSKFKIQNSKLYKTGDLTRYLPDGNIEYLGRIDNQIKIRGLRIELGEIETVLSQHIDVQTACVIIGEDTPGNQLIVAYIVPPPKLTPNISTLRQLLKAKLPDYMIPSAFVILESLPLTPNGKVNRGALPAPDLSQPRDNYIAPRNPTEEMLAQIWGQVLKVEQVGINDNFFELGGHSLLATQLVSRIRNTFRLELPLPSLFNSPTVAELAKLIGQLQQQNVGVSFPPLLARANETELALSYSQQRLWFLDQFQPNSALYNIVIALRLAGTLNITALEQSLQAIIERHEALRTNFISVEGEASQIIHPETSWRLSVAELTHLSTNEQEAIAQQLAQKQAIQPFDLEKESLIRATLIVLSETEHILCVCMHHIVSDGWSTGVLLKELTQLYNGYIQGKPSVLTALPIQYADFAIWQRQWLQGDILESQLSYWKEQLADAPNLLSLPTDRPRPAVQTFRGKYQEFALSAQVTSQLTKLSTEQDVTLFMTLLAAFDTLLYRYSGQSDILIGSPIANRNQSEIEGLIGFFVNTLVLRTHIEGNPSFTELLTQVREIAMAAYSHQDLPFEMLVEALQPDRDISYTPLFQVMFALNNESLSQLNLTGLTLTPLTVESQTSKFDLTLVMEKRADGLVGVWEYSTDLFDASTIERMTSHFVTLLEAIVSNPQQRIWQLPLLTEAEKRQLLIDWNNTQADYPQNQCIHQLFEEIVERTPNAIALVFENQQLTYQQLNCRANQLAHYLQSVGVGADVLVGLCVERSLEMVVGILGILKAGGAYVPLDPDYPTERLSFMLEDAQVSVILTQQQLLESLRQDQARVICLDTNWETIAKNSESNLTHTATGSNLAYVIYTSGSTGKPKGVLVNHSNVVRLFAATDSWYHFNSQDVWTLFHSYAFDFSVWEMWGALLYGGKLVVVPYLVTRSPESFHQLLSQEKVTILNQTPSAFRQLIQTEESITTTNNLNLRLVIFGGEALELNSLRPWFQRHGDQKPQLVNMYGITETTVHVTYRPLSLADLEGAASVIGRPIPDLQVYLLDQYLQPVPIGVPGEMYVGGSGVTRGYLNRSELTAQRFISNPFSDNPQGQLYKTGDLARYLANGELEYLGRIDNQVKIRGFRIELGEIEALLTQHPNVWESVVMMREDEAGDKRLVAYAVPQSNSSPTAAQLRQFLEAKLPAYMVPNAFVILESLPLTANGKINRPALPAPDLDRDLTQKYVAPRTPTEEMLAKIWGQVLKVELVSIHDNFFELGGHSLLATKLISKIRNAFQVELSLRELFSASTLIQLSECIEQLKRQNSSSTASPVLPKIRKRRQTR